MQLARPWTPPAASSLGGQSYPFWSGLIKSLNALSFLVIQPMAQLVERGDSGCNHERVVVPTSESDCRNLIDNPDLGDRETSR
jgi:hypothetical protein